MPSPHAHFGHPRPLTESCKRELKVHLLLWGALVVQAKAAHEFTRVGSVMCIWHAWGTARLHCMANTRYVMIEHPCIYSHLNWSPLKGSVIGPSDPIVAKVQTVLPTLVLAVQV